MVVGPWQPRLDSITVIIYVHILLPSSPSVSRFDARHLSYWPYALRMSQIACWLKTRYHGIVRSWRNTGSFDLPPVIRID